MAQQTELKPGDPAPKFSLYDQNNQLQTVDKYKGKWLVIYFYPKDDTPGCTQEACNFRDDIADIRKLNAIVLGISMDKVSSHKEFAEKYSLPFPLLSDPKGKIAKQYAAYFSLGPIKFARRHSFIIDPAGKIAKIYRDVDSKTHSTEIIRDLTKLAKQTQ